MCKKGWCVGLGQEEGSLREDWGNCLTLKVGGIEEGSGNKNLKNEAGEASWVKGWVP